MLEPPRCRNGIGLQQKSCPEEIGDTEEGGTFVFLCLSFDFYISLNSLRLPPGSTPIHGRPCKRA
jgi:hypothetical protein